MSILKSNLNIQGKNMKTIRINLNTFKGPGTS